MSVVDPRRTLKAGREDGSKAAFLGKAGLEIRTVRDGGYGDGLCGLSENDGQERKRHSQA
jgi:hypothetical protein